MRKVGIVGWGPSRRKAPWHRHDWEIWGCNGAWAQWMPRCDIGFEIHPLSTLSAQEKRDLRTTEIPVWMMQRHARIPMSRTYPLAQVMSRLGCSDVFTCTFCYQIALALYQGVDVIGLWGIAFHHGGSPREQTTEWRGLSYWIGYAEGLGVDIVMPDRRLVTAPRYGLNYWPEVRAVRRYLDGLRQKMRRRRYDGIKGEATAETLKRQLRA